MDDLVERAKRGDRFIGRLLTIRFVIVASGFLGALVATLYYYATGDIARAIFWLLITGAAARVLQK